MADVSMAMQAKSDQLNYDDIGSREMILHVTEVRVSSTEQPVSIFYQGCNNKPYKPSKGMIRLISEAWGAESDNWIGKSIKIYGDPTVVWAGQAVGGIRIKAFSHIDKNGISAFVALTRGKRRKVTIEYLDTEPPAKEFDTQAAIKWLVSEKKKIHGELIAKAGELIPQGDDLTACCEVINNLEKSVTEATKLVVDKESASHAKQLIFDMQEKGEQAIKSSI